MIDLYIFETINNAVRGLMIIYFFNRVSLPKQKNYVKFCSWIITILYIVMSTYKTTKLIPDLQGINMIFSIIIACLFILIYPFVCKKGRLSEKFLLVCIYISMMQGCAFIVFAIFSNLLNIPIVDIIAENTYKGNIIVLIARFIQFLIMKVFLSNIRYIRYIKDKTLYVGGIILILNQTQVLIIIRDITKNAYGISVATISMLSILCMIYILLVYMLSILSKDMEENFILKMNLNRKVHDEEIISMYKEVIGWKHDFKNHINMMLGLLEISSKDEVISYIKEIDSSIDELDQYIYTDNTAINSILINKVKMAEEKNINLSLQLKIDYEIGLSNVDLCIILGNLLDNSIEACSLIEGDKFIDLVIVSQENKLVIKVKNNTNGHVKYINGKFLTTKNNSIDGMGLNQIDNIVKKHKGYINRKHENNLFTTYLMIQDTN